VEGLCRVGEAMRRWPEKAEDHRKSRYGDSLSLTRRLFSKTWNAVPAQMRLLLKNAKTFS
jgi:hypothetical protein